MNNYFTLEKIDDLFWKYMGLNDESQASLEERREFAKEKIAFRTGYITAFTECLEIKIIEKPLDDK